MTTEQYIWGKAGVDSTVNLWIENPSLDLWSLWKLGKNLLERHITCGPLEDEWVDKYMNEWKAKSIIPNTIWKTENMINESLNPTQ